MHPFLQNKFVKFTGVGLLVIIGLLIVVSILVTFLNSGSLSMGDYRSYESSYGAPSFSKSGYSNSIASDSMGMEMMDSSYYHEPEIVPTGYSADLESYETTSYSVTGRIKPFDELCSTLKTLKADSQIHFKSIYETTNNCRANFYVEEEKADSVLSTLTSFRGIEYTRNTSSVTKHRQQLQSRTGILKQQLASVQRSLSTAETQLNNLNDFYLTSNEVSELSKRVNESLQLIDQLTQRKINLTSQLNNLYQQSAELEERMNVIEFSVNVSRSNPIYVNKNSQKWENAWEDLKDTYTDTLIGLTAFLGVFVLTGVQYLIYLTIIIFVLILMIRGFWKMIKFLWKK